MLILRIFATIFLGVSCIAVFIKNAVVYDDWGQFIPWTIYSIAWRAFVITTIWLI